MKLYRVRLVVEQTVVVLAEDVAEARRAARLQANERPLADWGRARIANTRQVWTLVEVPRGQRDVQLVDGTTPRGRLA